MSIGNRIKTLRKDTMHMSQVAFADEINVSKQTLYKYENDIVTNIPSEKIEAIAKFCNVSPAYLMGWTDDPIDYDNMDDVFIPDEYKKLGMDVEKYLAFKKAEAEDAQRESSFLYDMATLCAQPNTTTSPSSISLNDHECRVVLAYRNKPEMQPAVDRLLEIESDKPSDDCTNAHLMPIAAHNDDPSEEQQALMQEDLDEL